MVQFHIHYGQLQQRGEMDEHKFGTEAGMLMDRENNIKSPKSFFIHIHIFTEIKD